MTTFFMNLRQFIFIFSLIFFLPSCDYRSGNATPQLIDIIVSPGPMLSVLHASSFSLKSVGQYVIYKIKTDTLHGTSNVLSSQQYYAVGMYNFGPTRDITHEVNWNSSVPSVCSFLTPHDGILSCTAIGAVSVSATLGDIKNSTESYIKILPSGSLNSISITPVFSSIQANSTEQFKAIGSYSDNSQIDITNIVTWNSNAPDIASVVSGPGETYSGLLTSVADGSVNISAVFEEITSNLATVSVGHTVTGISISPSTTQTIAPGETQIYTATLMCIGGPCPGSFTPLWSSSDTTCASVNLTAGSLTTTVIGVNNTSSQCTTTIEVTYHSFKASVSLNVSQATVIGISISPGIELIAKGETQNYTATLTCTGGFTCDNTFIPTWTNSDPTCATVIPTSSSLSIIVSGVNNTALMCATLISANYNTFTASVILKVSETSVVSITIVPAMTLTIAPGSAQVYTAKLTCAGGLTCPSSFTPTWSSSNHTICAMVSNTTGSLTTTTVGINNTPFLCSTIITATYNSFTASVTLKVSAAKVISIALSPSAEQTIASGETQTYFATLTCTGGFTCDSMFTPTWSSNLPTCATVSSTSGSFVTATGNNTAANNCSTNIIASYDTFNASSSLTVQAYNLSDSKFQEIY